MVGDVSDRGTSRVVVSPHGEKELVLRRRQARRSSLLRTPPQKPSQTVPQAQQLRVLVVGQPILDHRKQYIVLRYKTNFTIVRPAHALEFEIVP
jgi:hypothetical protein